MAYCNLDETSPSIDVSLENGITLLPYQKTVVCAALSIESNSNIVLTNLNEVVYGHTNGYIINDPVGSGKTFMILSIIIKSPVPKNIMDIVDKVSFNNNVKLIKKVKAIKSNLLIVDKSILIQWINYIKNNTKLTVFVISDVYKLKKFIKEFEDCGGNIKYNIVLLKNGKITNKIDNNNRIYEIIRNLTKNYKWARVIYDDYHILDIFNQKKNMRNKTFSHIDGIYNILISSSNLEEFFISKFEYKKDNFIDEFDYHFIKEKYKDLPNVKQIYKKNNKFFPFVINNKSNFIEKYAILPKIFGYTYAFASSNNSFIAAIKNVNFKSTHQIAEMLNSDAIKTAASELSIVATSIADIYDKLLGKNYNNFLQTSKILDNIENILKTAKINDENEDLHLFDAIIKLKATKLETISAKLKDMLEKEAKNKKILKEKLSQVINRLKENFEEESCQICLCPLDDLNIFIIKCCGIVLCDDCVIKGCKIRLSKGKLIGSCSKCMKQVNLKKDFVFLNKGADINKIFKDKIEEFDEALVEEQEEVLPPVCKFPKYQAIIDILNNKKNSQQKEKNINYYNILSAGQKNIPQEKNTIKKILIYTNYLEAQKSLGSFLLENKIEFMELKGTPKSIYNIIDEFKNNNINILLFSSLTYCSGMNIQYATDVIFIHKIIDSNIEQQVIGRAHRFGRQFNLNVHYLLYNNELV